MKKFLNIICLTAAFTLLFLHTDFSVSAKALDEDVIESGIYIGDVDVSGLTASEAMQKVTEYMDTIGEKKLTLNAMNNNTVVISMNDLEINWINTEIVQDAVKIAKDGNLVARYKVKKDLEHENLVLPMEYEVEKDAALKIISDKLEDRGYAAKILRFIKDLFKGKVKFEYPVQQKHVKELIAQNNEGQQRSAIFEYKKKWGLADIEDSHLINEILDKHVIGADDLNGNGELDNIVMEGQAVYRTDAEAEEVKGLSRIKYRTKLRHSINEFADELKKKF